MSRSGLRTSEWFSIQGLGVANGPACAALVTLVAVAAGGTHSTIRALIPLAIVIGVVAARCNLSAVLLTTATGWALYSGFVVGREGNLTFTGATGAAAAALVGTATVVLLFRWSALRLPRSGDPSAHRPVMTGVSLRSESVY